VQRATACAHPIKLHLAFDPFLVLDRFSPIDFELLAEHDRPDERVGSVG
jgi:hypothetical protein